MILTEKDIWLTGGKEAVLLFHSFTSTPVDFTGLAQFLSRQGYTVYAPALPGHGGQSILETLNYDMNDWKNKALACYDELVEAGHLKISVCGLSLGGILATYVALKRPVASLGTFSSPLIPDFQTQVPHYFDQYVRYEANKNHAQIPNYQEDLKRVLFSVRDLIVQMMPDYSKIKIPVFIGQGGQDEMIDPTVAQSFKEKLTHARVDFHLYEEAPHVITTGRAGQALRKDLLTFLKSI